MANGFGLTFIDDELAILRVVTERRVAADPQDA
jgi:hypothetical protein